MIGTSLEAGERQFRRIAEAISQPVWSASTDGACTFVNRCWCRYTGLSFEQALGTGWLAAVHPDDCQQHQDSWLGAWERGQVYEAECRLRREDGTYRSFAVRADLLVDDEGRPVRWFWIATDIHDRKQADAANLALRDSEHKYHRLIDSIRDAFVVVDMDGRIQECNAAYRDMLGYSDEELRGLTYVDLTPPRWHALEDRILAEQILPNGSSDIYSKEYRHKDGRVFPIELRTYLVRDDAGAPHRMWAIVRDITGRRQVEAALAASEHRYRAVVEAANAVTWTCEPDGVQRQPQSAWMAFTGQRAEAMLGDGWTAAVHPDDVGTVVAGWRAAAARGVPFAGELRIRRHDGAWRWMQVTVAPVRDEDGAIVEWFGANVDVTERKLAEEQLREADRRKDQFLAILAHELRNPLAPIRTAVALLKTRPSADPLIVQSRDVIGRQISQMARLLDDLLDVSRLSRGTFTLRRSRVELREILEAAIETAVPLTEERAQRLDVRGVDDSVMLDGDPARLVQIFGNLLTNASKYSPARTTIAVSVRVDGDAVVVAVRDAGIGIAPEHLATVFELFSQIDPSGQVTSEGLGIGLALVKRLVELHGGTITAASDGPGRGSTFTVRLPIVRVSAAPRAQPASAFDGPPIRRRVLVADDNQDAADMMALLLDQLGCDVRTVYAGEPAVREAEAFHPDVAFLDLGLPDLDGREVCRRIRSQTWGSRMVLVALTGWGREEDRRRTRQAGFDRHLVKPADLDTVVRLIRDLPSNSVQ